MRLRPATVEDVDPVASLETELFGDDAWSAASVREELTGPRRTAVVAESDDGQVVGYVVTLAAGGLVDLQRVGVHPGHRRRGLAGRLLAAVATDRMLLEVAAGNEAARALYAGAGFVEIARRRAYYRDGSDAVVMERATPR